VKTGGLTLEFPGAKTLKPIYIYIYNTKFISGFRKSGFRDMRRQEVSHLSSQEPKLQSLYIYIYITKFISGFHKSGFHDM
jgi:hypothetical protein